MPTAIRFTAFPPGGPPMTVIATEESFRDSVGDTNLPSGDGVFVIRDVFDYPGEEESLARATFTGTERAHERLEREANMAIMYHWTVAQSFRACKDGGTIAQTQRSPLTADELRYCHEQLALHPDYKDYRFVSLAEDGAVVTYP